jgi:LuxR family maltose regulon positive regulatory protein
MHESEFVLKSTPPRLTRSALERERFVTLWDEVRDCTAIAVIATAGFGKTTLLSQWRLHWLGQGAFVAWLTVDAEDEPARFAQGLLHALRAATGRPGFAALAGRAALQSGQELEAVTALLAEVAQLGSETVLVLDDAERLPEASVRGLLAYLVHNAPPNLHVLVGSRQALAVATAELSAKGKLAVLRTEDLRLRQEESISILQRRLGGRIDLDGCVRLHDACEGWPIGLQLAAATVERSSDTAAAIASLSGRQGDLGDYFMQSLFSRLPQRLADFLVRVSILERFSPELAEALIAGGDAAQCLQLINQETPFLIYAEEKELLRLHPLARDFLLERFEQLPAEDRDIYHCRAYHWFARRDRFHEAASHALAAGDLPATHAHAARALWTLGTQGRLAQAEAWLQRIPAEVLAKDVELGLVAAWIMVFGERHGEALATAQAVLGDPGAEPRLLLIASRVAAGAASYSDRLGLIPAILERAPDPTDMDGDPLFLLAYQNTRALLHLHAGEGAEVRALAAKAPAEDSSDSLPLALAFSRVLAGLSHLWDGNLAQVRATLQAPLQEAERETGRRGMVACMYAAVLAAAARDGGDPEQALALLADRLDAIERTGLPDTVMLAYLTLARVALDRDDERRALSVLENLCEYARRRQLPRLLLHGLAERLRIHARSKRAESAAELLVRIEELDTRFAHPDLRPFRQQYDLLLALARAQSALARDDLAVAERSLVSADAIANLLGRHRYALQAKALRAVLAHRQGEPRALAMAREAFELAELGGYHRLAADAPLLFAELLAGPRAALPSQAPAPRSAPSRPAIGGGLLTPKEARILELLDQGMSNKLIARAMEISDETVKWHLKNLFAKLSAGTRKHAVGRARLLGLIAS